MAATLHRQKPWPIILGLLMKSKYTTATHHGKMYQQLFRSSLLVVFFGVFHQLITVPGCFDKKDSKLTLVQYNTTAASHSNHLLSPAVTSRLGTAKSGVSRD
jgi:hypothetical protein